VCLRLVATLNLVESAGCDADFSNGYTKDKATVCGNYLSCTTCPEWANQYSNNTKCLSGGEWSHVTAHFVCRSHPYEH